MAVFEPVISTGGSGVGNGLELFVSTDIYRYEVDNRPLLNLADNDVALKASIDALVAEVIDAYDGKQWPAGTDFDWSSLDGRLDNMDTFLQELFDVRNVQFSAFQQSAAFLRERYTSGFMNGPYPDKFIRSNYAMENNEFMPSPFGGFYAPETAWTVKNQDYPDETALNTIAMETRIEQDGVSRRANTKPVYVLINGFVIPMLNTHGGVKDVAGTIDDHRAYGNWGQVTINFPPAPTTGHRFDLAWVEMWLQEVDPAVPRFYPYGARDYGIWAYDDAVACDGIETDWAGTVAGKDIVKQTELGWGFQVYLRDDPHAGDPVDWSGETPVCRDNGSGVMDPVGGSGWEGTVDYDTGAWTIDASSAAGGFLPAAGKDLVILYRHQAVTDPTDERLQGTISFMGDGNYVQVQHRLRVHADVDYESYHAWMDDTTVEARGPNDAVVSGYTFLNGLNDFHDGTLWFAGTGNAASRTDLGTLDGYVYAVPLCAWSRFNTTAWSYSNQNGGTDRPDGLSYDVPDDRHFLDLRPVVFSERYGMLEAAENTLDRIIRGDHRSLMGEASVSALDNGVYTDQGVWGVEVPELWRVYKHGASASETNLATVRDIGLSTSADATDYLSGYEGPIAHHDGIRRIFSPQEEVQEVPINIVDVTSSTSCTPSPVIEYNNSTGVITLTTTDNTLSGWSATTGKGVLVNDSYPRLWWRATRQPVIYSTPWSGLGTNTATATLNTSAATYEPNGTIDGVIELIYPESTGIGRPLKYVDHVAFNDGVNNYETAVAGNEDGSPDDKDMVLWKIGEGLEPGYNLPAGMCLDPTDTYVYVCDAANNRVVRIDKDTLEYDAQWPTVANYDSSWTLATHLRYPADVACDAAGNVYVADRDTHRVVKLNAGLTSLLGSFGDGTAANSAAHTTRLDSPEGVTVDSAGAIYVADTGLFRLVKLNTSLLYVSQIGDGTPAASKTQFLQPMGLDCGSVGGDEYVYVADESRVVLVDPTLMTIETVLGSMMGAETQQFFRNHSWVSISEDAAGNKYCVSDERKQVLKFNAGFQLIATFGEDGVIGFDEEHVTRPRDVLCDNDAGLVYIADYQQPGPNGDEGRVIILDATDLSYLDQYDLEQITGMAMFPSASTTGKLYCAGGDKLYKLALPAPGSRGTASSWSEDWSSTGFGGDNDFAFIHDVEINAAGTIIYVGEFLRGRVYKVDPSGGSPSLTDTCDLVTESKTPAYPAAIGVTTPYGMCLDATEAHLYACGGGLPGATTTDGWIRDINTATMTAATNDLYDRQNWPSGGWPFNVRLKSDGNMYLTMADHTTMLVYEQPFTPATGNISTNFLYDLAALPLDIDLDLAVEWENVRAVHLKDDILYVTDLTANTITSVNAANLLVMGQIGSPAVVGRGKASMAGPGGVVVDGAEIWFSDTFNNRVIRGYRFFPNVEKGTGRITYLIAPPSTIDSTFQARYAPYQGWWTHLPSPGVYGRHFVSDTNQLYITTLGRGTPTTVTQDGGMGFYANMIAHLPTPIDCPTKGPRVTDEYLFAPEPLPITGESGGTPYARLPVINRYPASAQEIQPYYGGGSRFDFTRVCFIQGPGQTSEFSAYAVPLDYVQRGFEATGTFPGFDTLETFPLKTISIPRVLFSTAIMEIDGEGYLVIYSTYRAEERNRLNDGTPIAADLFKLFGNPGIRTRY